MTRIVVAAAEPAEDILAELELIDPADEPQENIDPFGGTASATFSTGLVSLVNLQAGIPLATITDGTVSRGDGSLLLEATQLGLLYNVATEEITNLDEIEGIDLGLVDAPDRLDADGYLALTSVLAGIFQDLPINALREGIVVDFGDQPPAPSGPFDAGNYDTLVFDVPRAEITEAVAEDGSIALSSAEGTATAIGLERLELSDGTYVYDLSDDVSFVYRLYAASLARTPDEAGLRFWDGVYSGDSLRPRELAQRFADSQEFADNFLTDPSDEGFVEALYTEVLGRGSDAAGQDFWVGRLGDPGVTRGDMLKAFADSREFIDNTADDLDAGVWVLPADDMMM